MKIRLLTLLLPLTALAAVQGPDAGGYSATDTAVFSFIDISGGGGGTSILSSTDDGTVNVTMPFSFQFYGTGYTNVCVSSNGAAYLLSDSSACGGINDFANTDLSSGAPSADHPALFPFWSDLTFQTPGAGSVFYQTLGSAPNRRFIIQWNNAYPQGSATPVTFQIVLSETTNAIAFQYQTVTLGAGDPANNGGLATIGIRNASAQTTGQQLQWAFNSAVLADGAALAFTKGAGPLPPVLISPSNGSGPIAPPVTLTWGASAGATSYDVYFAATNPPTLVANVTSTTYAPATVPSTTYNWQVVAKNGAGNGASAIWSFTTAAASSGGGGGGGTPVSSSSALSVTPDTLNLSLTNTAAPATQVVKLTYQSYSAVPPTYSTTFNGNQAVGWLKASPATGTLKQTAYAGFLYTYSADITVTADPAGIATGSSYQGNVNFLAGDGIATVAVNLNVVAQPAQLTLSSQAITFAYRKGDPALPARTLNLTSKPTPLAFTATATTTSGGNWLSASAALASTPSAITVSANSGIVNNLAPGTYSGKVTITTDNGTATVPVTLVVVAPEAPLVSEGGVVPVFSTTTVVQSGSWISIYGTKLAPTTVVWNGEFPTSLGGVSVTVNGKPAYLWFVSPNQINLQSPDDTTTGAVPVVVTTPSGTFTSTVTLAAASPSLSLLDSKHVAALAPNSDGTFDIVGPTGAFSFPTRPVAPGDALVLYGVGFGPTNPPVKPGVPVTTAVPTVNPVTVTIGGVNATVTYSGLVSAGLYQINVTVPANIPSGDQPVRATVSGLQSGPGAVVTIK